MRKNWSQAASSTRGWLSASTEAATSFCVRRCGCREWHGSACTCDRSRVVPSLFSGSSSTRAR